MSKSHSEPITNTESKESFTTSILEQLNALEAHREILLTELNKLEAKRTNQNSQPQRATLKINETKVRALGQQLEELQDKYYKSKAYVAYETENRNITTNSKYTEEQRQFELSQSANRLKGSQLYMNYEMARKNILIRINMLSNPSSSINSQPQNKINEKNRKDLYSQIARLDEEITRLNKNESKLFVIEPQIQKQKIKELDITPSIYLEHVEPILNERAQKTETFNRAFTDLANVLKKSQQADTFIERLRDIIARGIIDTSLKRNKAEALYHDAPHAAEMAADVRRELNKLYTVNNDDSIEAKLITVLAEAAAAFHDVIQGKSDSEQPKANEELSAKLLAENIQKIFTAPFQEKLNSGQNPYAVNKAVHAFKAISEFLADQLIVPSTYLIRPQTKPLLHYVAQFEEPLEQKSNKTPIEYLDEAAITISFCDTNRSLLLDVIKDKISLNELEKIVKADPQTKELMDKLFEHLELKTEEDKEGFLLRMGQNFRMFPELNKFRSGESKLSLEEIQQMLTIARPGDADANLSNVSTGKFLLTYLKSIEGEIKFAQAMGNPEHLEMLARKKIPNLLTEIDSGGWGKHAKHLKSFDNFVVDLDNSQKDKLGLLLIMLAGRQAGVKLMAKNKEVQTILSPADSKQINNLAQILK